MKAKPASGTTAKIPKKVEQKATKAQDHSSAPIPAMETSAAPKGSSDGATGVPREDDKALSILEDTVRRTAQSANDKDTATVDSTSVASMPAGDDNLTKAHDKGNEGALAAVGASIGDSPQIEAPVTNEGNESKHDSSKTSTMMTQATDLGETPDIV